MFKEILLDERLTVTTSDTQAPRQDFARDVLTGLTAVPKRIPSVYFYDAIGSQIFEEICELPEYYLTRTEHAIIGRSAAAIASYSNGNMALVEFGSGSSTKTRTLIEALVASQGHLNYFPIDISESILVKSAEQLIADYPELSVCGTVAEYQAGIHQIASTNFDQKLVLFLGSNIGNFDYRKAIDFLSKLRRELDQQDYLLLGTDMQKDIATIRQAYDDPWGVTAKFNLNLLRRINRELYGEFRIEDFSHVSIYNRNYHRIESYLRSEAEQTVYIGKLQKSFNFKKSEMIHTEVSHKYSPEQIQAMAEKSGLRVVRHWEDERGYFRLNLLKPL